MKKFWLVLCSVCLLSSAALAQVKVDNQWKCGKATVQHSIDVGDKPGHAYAVDQINCTSTKGEIEGVKIKSGVGTEFFELSGDNSPATASLSKPWPMETSIPTRTSSPAP